MLQKTAEMYEQDKKELQYEVKYRLHVVIIHNKFNAD